MKRFNSIRWRLQLWYGLILVLVLSGLGTAAFELERGKLYRQVDQGLMRRANAAANSVHGPGGRPRRPGPGEEPGPRPLPEDAGQPAEGPPDRPPFADNSLAVRLHDPSLFDSADPNGFYYVLFGRDGRVVDRSTNAPAGAVLTPEQLSLLAVNAGDFQGRPDRGDHLPPGPGERFGRAPTNNPAPWTRETYRELVRDIPPGGAILVGRSIKGEVADLRWTGLELAGIGGVILLIGLAGGGWLVTRAIRPVEAISVAAQQISAGDLSQRINVAETESELGQLASVLNSTFARLEAAFVRQRQFTADAAHELRTPVTVILTQTQLALSRDRSAEDYRQTLEACQRSAQRMRRLIESLLELARYDAGQESLQRAPFDLAPMVAECVELVRPLAEEKSVTLAVQLVPLQVTGDAERLSQVVMNLLTNAIQYNRPAGEVRIVIAPEPGRAVVTVTDTGRGIAPEDLPRVFERFYRADKSRTGGANSGLGLSICQAIVEAHGGTLEAASEPGAGSTFTLRLPA